MSRGSDGEVWGELGDKQRDEQGRKGRGVGRGGRGGGRRGGAGGEVRGGRGGEEKGMRGRGGGDG